MPCRTIGLLLTLALGFLMTPFAADAQPAGRVVRISILAAALGSSSPLFEAFRQGMRELGWIEGQNIIFESRFAEGRNDRLPKLAAELVQLPADVIVTDSTAAAQAAKNATETIPIVMATIADPLRSGLVASLAHPGRNVTGLTLLAQDLDGKRLELLKEAVPTLARVAVLLNAANPGSVHSLSDTQKAAQTLGLQLQILQVRGPDEFEGAFAAATTEHADGLIQLSDAMLFQNRARFVDLAAKHRLPAIYEVKGFAEVGGLMSYGPNIPDQYRRAATYVDKILKGAKPADLPVEQPMKFELVINLKTAQALGLTIPPMLLFQADEIIR
jgi:putative tryptophan/tyrosine transport system substrate-binding protein